MTFTKSLFKACWRLFKGLLKARPSKGYRAFLHFMKLETRKPTDTFPQNSLCAQKSRSLRNAPQELYFWLLMYLDIGGRASAPWGGSCGPASGSSSISINKGVYKTFQKNFLRAFLGWAFFERFLSKSWKTRCSRKHAQGFAEGWRRLIIKNPVLRKIRASPAQGKNFLGARRPFQIRGN